MFSKITRARRNKEFLSQELKNSHVIEDNEMRAAFQHYTRSIRKANCRLVESDHVFHPAAHRNLKTSRRNVAKATSGVRLWSLRMHFSIYGFASFFLRQRRLSSRHPPTTIQSPHDWHLTRHNHLKGTFHTYHLSHTNKFRLAFTFFWVGRTSQAN